MVDGKPLDDLSVFEALDDGTVEILDDGLGETADSSAKAAEELESLRQEYERLRDSYVRKLAEFDNYRKRQEREMAEFRKLASAELVRDLLPVMDNLERALAVTSADAGGLREGVELVLRQLRDALTKHGVELLNPLGEAFDPAFHEAVQRRETNEVVENTIVEVLQKGFLMHGRLLRAAMVVVAVPGPSAPAAPSPAEEGG
jgi:molecular chaperone GrpE